MLVAATTRIPALDSVQSWAVARQQRSGMLNFFRLRQLALGTDQALIQCFKLRVALRQGALRCQAFVISKCSFAFASSTLMRSKVALHTLM